MRSSKPAISNPGKLYWPKEGITKGELLSYYESIAPHILPYLKNRPLSLRRNPNGILDEGFYHKDAGDIAPAWMKTANIYSESSDKIIHYLVCNNVNSLLFIANLGCIEMNPWNSVISKLDRPDYLVIDIDPSEKNDFEQVIEVALATREVCEKLGIAAFCKTSGASGIHIYIPCNKKYDYDQVRDFAKVIASLVNEMLPSITTMERSLAKRKKNQIYIDYLQNSAGQTLASVYSARPKPGATVSTPLDWKEVKPGLHPSQFTIKNILKRVEKKGDIFSGILGRGINIPAALKKIEKSWS
ncbi:MAG TPA: non-homologous end-joining DNA ligase [Chitinophagaceae bacterium]|nr:non-homologous end-joining DNA ligase [Chitinophagaceae bacterium]